MGVCPPLEGGTSGPGGLFAGDFKPGEMGELFRAMACGHSDIGKTFHVPVFGGVFSLDVVAEVGRLKTCRGP